MGRVAPGDGRAPLPPGWGGAVGPGGAAARAEATAQAGAPNAMTNRPPMRSPYRLVPILIALFVVAVAIWQGTRPPRQATSADVAAAQALVGQCLVRTGGTASSPRYSPAVVPCSERGATVKVVAVLVPGRRGSCPANSDVVQVLQPGVLGEPSECVVPVKR